MNDFPLYFKELYLKLPFSFMTYWNDEDECQMIEVWSNNKLHLQTHADSLDEVSDVFQEILLIDMQTAIMTNNKWPLAFYPANLLFQELEETRQEMGYEDIIRFIEEEKMIVRSLFYSYIDTYQKGTILLPFPFRESE